MICNLRETVLYQTVKAVPPSNHVVRIKILRTGKTFDERNDKEMLVLFKNFGVISSTLQNEDSFRPRMSFCTPAQSINKGIHNGVSYTH